MIYKSKTYQHRILEVILNDGTVQYEEQERRRDWFWRRLTWSSLFRLGWKSNGMTSEYSKTFETMQTNIEYENDQWKDLVKSKSKKFQIPSNL